MKLQLKWEEAFNIWSMLVYNRVIVPDNIELDNTIKKLEKILF